MSKTISSSADDKCRASCIAYEKKPYSGVVSDLLLEYQGGTEAYYPVVSHRTLEITEFEEKSHFEPILLPLKKVK